MTQYSPVRVARKLDTEHRGRLLSLLKIKLYIYTHQKSTYMITKRKICTRMFIVTSSL